MAKLYFEDVQEGQEVPEFVRKTDYMNWNRYAAVNDEFVYIHMDDEAGRLARQSGGFGMGNLRFAYMHNMLHEWMGDDGDIKKLGIQYRGFNFKNDVLTCGGRVSKKYEEDGEHLIDLEIWVKNQKDEVVSPGNATIALPSRG
jgi:acyl dehydratase